MLPGLGKERFRRALQGKAAVALETWNRSDIAETTASGNSGIYARRPPKTWSAGQLELAGPQDFPLRSAIGVVFVMLESTILDFHGERTQNRYL